MMKFYIPEISEVQQVTTEEEKKSQDVFDEFDKKLDEWYQIELIFFCKLRCLFKNKDKKRRFIL